ncbi:hypothetical protein BC03BB108_4378 [Bacillus cereus 03BB108]|nr:hypothetical protein BC03BB108_4378 [Bacillus cereus 03BB108]
MLSASKSVCFNCSQELHYHLSNQILQKLAKDVGVIRLASKFKQD